MIGFFLIFGLFHLMLFWLWRTYLKEHPEVYFKDEPSKFESMMFWPQFLGIMKGKPPRVLK